LSILGAMPRSELQSTATPSQLSRTRFSNRDGATEKTTGIEYLRVFSALGVVTYHSNGRDGAFIHPGLVIFLMLSMYLGGATDANASKVLRRRLNRLIAPWFVWFMVYGFINILRGRPIVSMSNGLTAGILSGSSAHLWYMPFVFFCLISTDLLRGKISDANIAIFSGLLATFFLASASVWRPASIAIGYPVAQWAYSIGAILIGVFFLHLDKVPTAPGRALLVFILLGALCASSIEDVGINYAISIIVFAIIYSRRLAKILTTDISALSGCTLGIYFSHTLFLSLLTKMGVHQPLLLPVLTFVLSALFVATFRQAFPKMARYWS
jgi:surface polysaccharide O-acyltransferase-like enzyme